MKKVCEQTMGPDSVTGRYYKCGRPAKFIGAENKCGLTRPPYLCGIHKQQYDSWYKKTHSTKRCTPLPGEDK